VGTAPSFSSLAAERDALEAEIAELRRKLSRVEARLARPKPRDRRLLAFVLGTLAGLVVTGGCLAWALQGLSTAIGNYD
jgi:hypothetical protein